jgi:metal-sulfur cluster biosynthetic enzyme
MPLTQQSVIESLKQVYDPEVQVDVWTMGLIYKITINTKDNTLHLLMTLTTPTCPYGPMLLEEIHMRLKEDTGAKDVQVEVTFDPPWQPSEELRAMLGV